MRTPSILILIVIFLLAGKVCNAQNFIGMHRDEIMKTMKESQKKLKLNTTAVNPHYNYLKYEDRINEITMLFFLSEKNKCTRIRMMCDYSNINDIEAELNKKFKSEGYNNWYYKVRGRKYNIVLVEEDWYFTVTTKKDD